jgi:hypothetical protein
MIQDNKPIPVFKTDEQLAAFVETADLSEYDLSGFRPVSFRIATDVEDLLLHIPPQTWKKIQEKSEMLHVSKETLISQWIDAGLR